MEECIIYRVCLTGHRPKDTAKFMAPGLNPYDLANPYWQAVAKVLANHIKDLLKQHPDGLELHSGMALGADTIWAKVILAARKRYGFNKSQLHGTKVPCL